MAHSPTTSSPQHSSNRFASWLCAATIISCLLTIFTGFFLVQPFQINIVTYDLEARHAQHYGSDFAFGLFLLLVTPLCWALCALRAGWMHCWRSCAPLALTMPLVLATYTQDQPPLWTVYLFIVGMSWSVGLAVGSIRCELLRPIPPFLCLAMIFATIVGWTFVHVHVQRNFFEHFMLGHADIGHFTEHLKNAAAGRGLRADSFPNPHFGVHFTPLMYLLVPGYVFWPSPTYLMVVGPILLHLPALIVYWASRRVGAATSVALILSMAWMLLPSLSRLVYCNTYGFQWTYFSLPWVTLCVTSLCQGQWKLYWLSAVAVLLCQETFAAIVFGTGLYLLLFTRRRWSGVFACALSVFYLLLCTQIIIPYFAAAGRFERIDLFGEFGRSLPELLAFMVKNPLDVLERLMRGESADLLALLLIPMAMVPLLKWRLMIVALPTLFFLLILANPDWLSIKFWHHAPILPIVFVCALYACVPQPGTEGSSKAASEAASLFRSQGLAVAILMAAGWGHYFFGFSPLSKAYALYAQDPLLSRPDPRFAFIEDLRARIDRSSSILATERMAAHFTDFAHIYTGAASQPVDFIILDRSDTWDPTGLPRRMEEFAANPDYRLHSESGPVIVFQRVPGTHQTEERWPGP